MVLVRDYDNDEGTYDKDGGGDNNHDNNDDFSNIQAILLILRTIFVRHLPFVGAGNTAQCPAHGPASMRLQDGVNSCSRCGFAADAAAAPAAATDDDDIPPHMEDDDVPPRMEEID